MSRSSIISTGGQGTVVPLDYDQEIQRLAYAIQALINKAVREDGKYTGPTRTGKYRGETGIGFTPKAGFVNFGISGWLGNVGGVVRYPLGPAEKRDILQTVTKYFASAKAEQDAALAIVPNVATEVIGPPPGYSVRFYGRRADIHDGPRISFSSMNVDRVVARLRLAIENAAKRDLGPPVGPWAESAEADKKIPIPAVDRIEIESQSGSLTLDVPTSGGGTLSRADLAKIRTFVAMAQAKLDAAASRANRGTP